ncbi:protein tyrosine phosphatase [Salinisphaera sp. PC39]
MAEGWARFLKRDTIEPYSAGVTPKGLDPRAVAVMAELGVDISHQRAKHVDELDTAALDYVVTVCDHAAETCPVLPGRAPMRHRGFQDPPQLAAGAASEEEALAPYRRVRDEIRDYIETLPQALRQPEASE